MPSMDYNPRMSMARTTQPTIHQKQRREDDDAFMTLDEPDIVGCIVDSGVPFTIEDLRKPSPQQIQRVFECFAESLTNTTREIVAPAMRAAAEEVHGDDADRIFTPDTRELMGFFITTRKLMLECGIRDFTFSDLYRPTHARLVKIFSYVINLLRFRESQRDAMEAQSNSSERIKNQIEQLYHANQEKADQLVKMQRNRKNIEQAIVEKEKRGEELKLLLIELQQRQKQAVEKVERTKGEQSRLKAVLQEKTAAGLSMRAEANKLRPYTEQSPAILEQSLRDLSSTLNNDRAEIERSDGRARALQTSRDTFSLLHADITSLSRLFTDLQNELQKEEDEARSASRNREALTEKSNNVRDVERQEKMLRKQLQQWQERTDKLRRDAEARAADAKKKMEDLRAAHKELSSERRERSEEVEKRKVRIEQTEKKMVDLKEQIEHEVQSAREEYMKMESHIRLYVTEMEQSI